MSGSSKAATPAAAATPGQPAAAEVVAAGGTMIEEVQVAKSGSGNMADGVAPAVAKGEA